MEVCRGRLVHVAGADGAVAITMVLRVGGPAALGGRVSGGVSCGSADSATFLPIPLRSLKPHGAEGRKVQVQSRQPREKRNFSTHTKTQVSTRTMRLSAIQPSARSKPTTHAPIPQYSPPLTSLPLIWWHACRTKEPHFFCSAPMPPVRCASRSKNVIKKKASDGLAARHSLTAVS